jgi:hypothetical protein
MTSLLDVDAQAVPPQWPPAAQSLVIEDGVYEVCVHSDNEHRTRN